MKFGPCIIVELFIVSAILSLDLFINFIFIKDCSLVTNFLAKTASSSQHLKLSLPVLFKHFFTFA